MEKLSEENPDIINILWVRIKAHARQCSSCQLKQLGFLTASYRSDAFALSTKTRKSILDGQT
jgi:hypothetical protein